MNDRVVKDTRGELLLSTDRARIDVDGLLALLHRSHWGAAMTRPTLERAIENSVCFGVYDSSARQLAFARAVTDLEMVLVHPDLQGLRRIALFTSDARALYERLGFSADKPPSTYLEMRPGPGADPLTGDAASSVLL
jgi:hypothetical protein